MIRSRWVRRGGVQISEARHYFTYEFMRGGKTKLVYRFFITDKAHRGPQTRALGRANCHATSYSLAQA